MPAIQGRSRSVSSVTLRSTQICLPKPKHGYQLAPSSMHVTTSPVRCTGTGPGLGRGCEVWGQLRTEQGSLLTAWTLQPNKGCSCQFYTYMPVFSCTLAACNTRCWHKDGPVHLYWLVAQDMICHIFKRRLMERGWEAAVAGRRKLPDKAIPIVSQIRISYSS